MQYVTDEEGKTTGVLLDIAVYQQLIKHDPANRDLLIGMSQAELEALASSQLAPAAQTRLDELLAQQKEEELTAEKEAELDRILAHIDQLTLLKTRARYTLAKAHPSP
jgi:hypothetical protein